MDEASIHFKPDARDGAPISYANSICELLMESGEFDDAEKVSRETLRMLAANCGPTKRNRNAVAIAQGTLGNLLLRRRLYGEAEEQYTAALKIYRETANECEGVGITYANLGALYEMRGDLGKAVEYWHLSRDVFSKIGDATRYHLVDAWVGDAENAMQRVGAPAPRRVLISVKYNHDQVIERSLAAYLTKAKYETFRHEGTVDLLHRVELPPIIADGPLTLGVPSLFPSGRRTRMSDVSPSLIRYLVEQVCAHPVVVVAWSAAYAGSFWCMLELRAAMLARKPIVLIRSDYHPLPCDFTQGIRDCPCEIMEIGSDYKTSEVFAVIERLFPAAAVPADIGEVSRQLDEFSGTNYRASPDSTSVRPDANAGYEEIVRILRNSDDRGELHPAIASLAGVRAHEYPELQGETRVAIQRLVESGRDLNTGLRQYLEDAASGAIEAPLEGYYYTYLLGEILDYRFLPPRLPKRLEEYYVRKINDALTPPEQVKVESLIDDLIQECLYTREFVEHFGHLLADV